ncbi:MAG: CxxH/CxxC protein [Clostridiaceae bacterium]|nr:CxxH/CxxC protein [Clostridiaceae bacterium]
MLDSKMYTCDQHLDKAFDHFLDENEVFPYLEKISIGTCSYCDCPAKYVLSVTSEDGHTQ